MDEELAMSSLAYLMRDYKEQDEVILNDDDIEAIKYLQKRNKRLQNNWNELKKWTEDEIIECKAIISTILPEFEKIMPRSSGKTLLINEYNKHQTIIKIFEVMLSKMQELEGNNE